MGKNLINSCHTQKLAIDDCKLVWFRKHSRLSSWTCLQCCFAGQNTIIQGLKPDTEYLFKVAAGNPVGFGNYSDVVRISTLAQRELTLGCFNALNQFPLFTINYMVSHLLNMTEANNHCKLGERQGWGFKCGYGCMFTL